MWCHLLERVGPPSAAGRDATLCVLRRRGVASALSNTRDGARSLFDAPASRETGASAFRAGHHAAAGCDRPRGAAGSGGGRSVARLDRPTAFADAGGMGSQTWLKVPLRDVDPSVYGRSAMAFRHPDGRATLVLHRPLSRGSRWFHRIGAWCVFVDGRLVRRRAAYGRRVRGTPWRWANAVRRRQLAAARGDSTVPPCPPPPPFDLAFRALPVSFDELPAVLAGHGFHGDVARPPSGRAGDPVVPAALPTVLPSRALSPRWGNVVVTREEYHRFLETWRAWAAECPAVDAPSCQAALRELCLAAVVLRRFECVCGRELGRRFAHAYDRACLRHRRARDRLRGLQAAAATGIRWTDLLAATTVRAPA